MFKTDCLIVGAGPIGLFSIFQAGMLGMKSHVVESLDFIGGQCSALYSEKPIYDIPGFSVIQSSDLIENLKIQSEPFKPTYHLGQTVIDIKKENDFFITTTSSGTKIQSKIVLIAAGCGSFGPNKPPIENIEEYEEKSVLYSVQSTERFKDKVVSIAGGGDSALDWAVILASISSKVNLIHRRAKFRAHEATVEKVHKLVEEGKIDLVIPYHLDDLEGDNGYIKNIVLKDLDDQKIKLPSDYLLAFFGLKSDIGHLKDFGFEIQNNNIIVDECFYQTSLEGIYAVGDISSYKGKIKLILTGFAESASALHHAYKKVFDKELHFQYSTSKGIPE